MAKFISHIQSGLVCFYLYNNAMNSRKLRFWIALVVLCLALGLLLASTLPLARVRQVVPLPPVALPTPAASLFFPAVGVF